MLELLELSWGCTSLLLPESLEKYLTVISTALSHFMIVLLKRQKFKTPFGRFWPKPIHFHIFSALHEVEYSPHFFFPLGVSFPGNFLKGRIPSFPWKKNIISVLCNTHLNLFGHFISFSYKLNWFAETELFKDIPIRSWVRLSQCFKQ